MYNPHENQVKNPFWGQTLEADDTNLFWGLSVINCCLSSAPCLLPFHFIWRIKQGAGVAAHKVEDREKKILDLFTDFKTFWGLCLAQQTTRINPPYFSYLRAFTPSSPEASTCKYLSSHKHSAHTRKASENSSIRWWNLFYGFMIPES